MNTIIIRMTKMPKLDIKNEGFIILLQIQCKNSVMMNRMGQIIVLQKQRIIITTMAMVATLKQKIINNQSVQSILHVVSRPEWVTNLGPSDIDQLAKIVQNKQGKYKIHKKVATAIYSIIVMKQHSQYNTKLAIETLSKYYRELLPSQEMLSGQTHVEKKTRLVIANLLLRIPTFSNYKLIVKDLHPHLIGVGEVLEHRDRIYKQCPNLFKDHLVKQHKHVWHQLMQGDQSNYPLHQDFAVLKAGLDTISDSKDALSMHTLHADMEKTIQFIKNRLLSMHKQNINVQALFQHIESILKYEISTSSQRQLLLHLVIATQERYIQNIKSATVELLRLLIYKFKYFIYRRFNHLTIMLKQLFNRPYDNLSIEPAYLIALLTTLLAEFGTGFFNFDQVVHSQSTSCLFSLVSALSYNDYSKNNKQQASLINYQTTSTKNQQKKKHHIHINLYNTTLIDTSYEPYLKTTTPYQRQTLLARILLFLKTYYLKKLQLAAQFYYSSQILGVLSSSKNPISKFNQNIITDIKQNILFKGFKQVGDHFQAFCESAFTNFIKKRNNKKLQIHRTQQVVIHPKMKASGKEADSYISFISKDQSSNKQANQIKRTSSFDMQFQGWGNHRSDQKPKPEEGDKNQMFYSIKQCDIAEQKQQDNQQKNNDPNEQEHEFILTPQF